MGDVTDNGLEGDSRDQIPVVFLTFFLYKNTVGKVMYSSSISCGLKNRYFEKLSFSKFFEAVCKIF